MKVEKKKNIFFLYFYLFLKLQKILVFFSQQNLMDNLKTQSNSQGIILQEFYVSDKIDTILH